MRWRAPCRVRRHPTFPFRLASTCPEQAARAAESDTRERAPVILVDQLENCSPAAFAERRDQFLRILGALRAGPSGVVATCQRPLASRRGEAAARPGREGARHDLPRTAARGDRDHPPPRPRGAEIHVVLKAACARCRRCQPAAEDRECCRFSRCAHTCTSAKWDAARGKRGSDTPNFATERSSANCGAPLRRDDHAWRPAELDPEAAAPFQCCGRVRCPTPATRYIATAPLAAVAEGGRRRALTPSWLGCAHACRLRTARGAEGRLAIGADRNWPAARGRSSATGATSRRAPASSAQRRWRDRRRRS